MVVAIFGSLVSFLLGLLAMIGRNLTREVHELGKTVGMHGQKLSSIDTTLKHLDRRSTVLESKHQ